MKIPAMIAAELRRLTATRMSVIALVALMLVPVLYGGLYLWANHDPYGKFADIPVALVVSDEGVAASGDQPAQNYGTRIADQLVDAGDFAWQRLDADAATAALHDGDVDFIVMIPPDFSAALSSTSGDDPRQATIALETNDANNYLASSIGSAAVERIRTSVAQLVAKQGALALLDGVADIRTQISSAADGAAQVSDGLTQAQEGSQSASSGAAELADGASALQSGTAQVSSGAAQLAAGTAQVASGASTLSSGAAQVAAGGSSVATGAAQLDAATRQAAQQSQASVDALPAQQAQFQALLQSEGLDAGQIATIMGALKPQQDAVVAANTQLQAAVPQVDALSAGAAQVAAGQTAAGAAQLSQGAATAASGASSLSAGAQQTASGAASVASGSAQVRDGIASLDGGLSQIGTGAAQLRDGLDEGLEQIPDADPALRSAQAQVLSDPVEVQSSKTGSAQNYGAGLAPFFAALSGWIGIYALFLIVKPVSRRAVTALHSPVRVTLAGWLTPAILGGLQMAALFAVLAAALRFDFANPLGALGVMVGAAFVYSAIILALNVWLGSGGQFLGLVLMVLQLVTAGGTFPWQTLPTPLAWLHHVLPMGYVVDALRQVMYAGNVARVTTDLLVLLVWTLGALAIAAAGVTRMTHSRTLRDLQPSLIG